MLAAGATTAAATSGTGLIILLACVAVDIFYILALRGTLEKCQPPSRAMEPGMAWLLLIPLVNLIWNFFVAVNMAKTLANEFRVRGIPNAEAEPGKTLGLAMSVVGAVWLIPAMRTIAGLAYLVLWGFYWHKIKGYSSMLDWNPAAAAGYPAPGYPQAGTPVAGYAAPGYPPTGTPVAGYPAPGPSVPGPPTAGPGVPPQV